ncbi:MAG: DUF262 domain-containing protein [Symploca sp. SIO2G7]|nr:DUF262 domain-containing protein [Symploca sp. SIO2G7]
MARINLLDTRTTSFGDLIGNGKTYQVPLFQRNYSWNQENWEDLWQDIIALSDGNSHYMGAIVLQNQVYSDKTFTIIDGQQRLATLSILTIAVIEKIHQLEIQEIDIDDNKDRQEILRRTYLSDRDPRSLKYSSKLLLNETNNDFYQSNLINLRQPLNIRALKKSNQLLWEAFNYFSNELETLTKIIRDGEKLASFLTDTVAQSLLFIQINVEDEINAYTVFETLNARGIELSTTDLLKNYLFSLFQGPDDLKEAQRQWRRIINTVQMPKFPEFLRYYLSLKYIRVRSGQLFKLIRKSVTNNHQAFDLLDQLEGYSDLFIALSEPNDIFWQDRPDVRFYIKELNLFRVKQAYPTLFAAYRFFEANDFIRILKLVSIISFRYSVVSGLNPNDLEKLYNRVAIDIGKQIIRTPRQVFELLKPAYVSDEKFRQDFSLLTISTRGKKKKLVRYILMRLEGDISGRHDDEDYEDKFSIEHILPESPDNTWRGEFSESQIEELVYRLGNLTLLEPKLNRQVGNSSYKTKQATYQQSVYQLTQAIEAEEWTPNTLANRQRQLARRATNIWQSNFDA